MNSLLKKAFFVISISGILLLYAFQKPHFKYSFVVVGDCRVANKDTLNDPSTTNQYQLKRLFSEVAAINPPPKYLFFTGDLVMGYLKNDTVKLAHELEEWKKIYLNSPLAKTSVKLIVIPGNHETDEKINGHKLSQAANERVFIRVMKDYLGNTNGPKATGYLPGTDSLLTDQSQLTCSFNAENDHFVMMNTDPCGRDSRVPWHWLKNDLRTAEISGAQHIFLFCHKPFFHSHFTDEKALGEHEADRDSAWAAITKYNSDLLFCSHNHLWDTLQPPPGPTVEVIAGNAGAPPDKNWPDQYFGYTLVKVGEDHLDITSYGRNEERTNYTAERPEEKTTIRAHFIE